MNIETVILSAIGILAIVLVACLVSISRDRRRSRANSIFNRRPTLSVSVNQNRAPAPTVIERRPRPMPTVAERPRFDMGTNGGMF